jgi:Ca-activated chloride channel homolog
MSFTNWTTLFWLFVPASILSWIWLRDRLPSLELGSDRRLPLPQDYSLTPTGGVVNFFIKACLSFSPLLLAVAIILWAGPRHLGVPQEKRELTNIVFCLDLSGSMLARFGAGNRYDAAMVAINGFVEKRQGDAFALTVFGTNAQHWIPLTSDASAFRCAIPFLNPRQLPPGYGGGTMIGLALLKSREAVLEQETGDRMIILVSDGESFDLGNGEEERIGRILRDDRIVVYTIHIGDGSVPPEVSTVSTITGGRAFQPEDTQALLHVFEQIDRMQVAKLERTFAELLDWYTPFTIAGLALAALGLLSFVGLRYTPW